MAATVSTRRFFAAPAAPSGRSVAPAVPLCCAPLTRFQGDTRRCSASNSTRPLLKRGTLTVKARYGSPARGSPEILDRVLSAATYILPFMNAFVYARFLYHMQPLVKACLQPLLPAIAAYSKIPFASFIAFFALYLGIVNNQSMSRFVRFNAMQAILLDIGLILPRLVETVISPPSSGWGAQLYANSQSFIWIFITIWVAYGIYYSLMGQYGRIPFVGEAADAQVR